MIEVMRDPLVHIIRNAIDHGIEAPERRRAAGKAETGVIRLSAEQAGGNIVVDDNIPFGTIFTLYIPLTRDEHHG